MSEEPVQPIDSPSRRVRCGVGYSVLATAATTVVAIEFQAHFVRQHVSENFSGVSPEIVDLVAGFPRQQYLGLLPTLLVFAALLGGLAGVVWRRSVFTKCVALCLGVVIPLLAVNHEISGYKTLCKLMPEVIEKLQRGSW